MNTLLSHELSLPFRCTLKYLIYNLNEGCRLCIDYPIIPIMPGTRPPVRLLPLPRCNCLNNQGEIDICVDIWIFLAARIAASSILSLLSLHSGPLVLNDSPKIWIILRNPLLFCNDRCRLQLLRGSNIWPFEDRSWLLFGSFMTVETSLAFDASSRSIEIPSKFISWSSVIVTGLWRDTCT